MSENSKIEWCDHTFNPWHGCQKVSEGCKNCYAETLDNRWKGGHWGPGSSRREMGEAYWRQPFKWNSAAEKAGTPAKVFCASMADVFEDHPEVFQWRRRLFEIIEETPHLIWQLLTKRPENIMRLLPRNWTGNLPFDEFPPNVWIGTSVENQKAADERIPHLLRVPASVRFLSCEPLMGMVDLSNYIGPVHIDALSKTCGFFESCSMVNGGYGCLHPDQEEVEHGNGKCYSFSCPIASRLEPNEPLDQPIYRAFGLSGDEEDFVVRQEKSIHWVIVGGESGHHARPMHPGWVRSLRDQCAFAGVAFFFKQWGEWFPFYDRDKDDPDWANIPRDAHKTRRMNLAGGFGFHGDRLVYFDRRGKHKSGRLLDGIEHNQFPNP